jgi:hypothetical protein
LQSSRQHARLNRGGIVLFHFLPYRSHFGQQKSLGATTKRPMRVCSYNNINRPDRRPWPLPTLFVRYLIAHLSDSLIFYRGISSSGAVRSELIACGQASNSNTACYLMLHTLCVGRIGRLNYYREAIADFKAAMHGAVGLVGLIFMALRCDRIFFSPSSAFDSRAPPPLPPPSPPPPLQWPWSPCPLLQYLAPYP